MKHDVYTKFGICWNSADFSKFSKKLAKDCTYDSFDYFYKLKGRERLAEFFGDAAKANTEKGDEEIIDVHRGFFQRTNTLLKTIKECCIMVRRHDLKTTNILVFNKKLGKISSITGFNPDEVKSIRDIKI